MSIPFIDLKTQYHALKRDIDARIQGVLEHGRYIMGPEVGELEERLASFCGVKHAVGVANGTDALQAAFMAMGVGPGDGVLMPAFTFTATAEAVLILGAEPVFVDVLPDTFNIDVADCARKLETVRQEGRLTPKGIVAVDLFGQPADYQKINAFAVREGLFVVADAAQSFGAELQGKRVGGWADITTTSFFPAKPLGCYGDGGAVFTDDDQIATALRSIREHGKGTEKYDIQRVGLNSRLDTIQAAVLLVKLDAFEDEIEQRNRVAASYRSHLQNLLEAPTVIDGAKSVWAQYTVRHNARDALIAHLSAAGVPSAIYYPRPLHQQNAYSAFDKGGLAISERLSGEVLSLPMHPYLGEQEIERIADVIREFCIE
jgi:UDP-2-acetamido-2-deoxy-ribo-hexuluronate aminotransferase